MSYEEFCNTPANVEISLSVFALPAWGALFAGEMGLFCAIYARPDGKFEYFPDVGPDFDPSDPELDRSRFEGIVVGSSVQEVSDLLDARDSMN